jgi:hypothetical protein
MAKKQALEAVPTVGATPMKTFKSFSIARKDGGWVMITTTVEEHKGDYTVVDITETQPDQKPIAVEAFKIAAAKYWTSL